MLCSRKTKSKSKSSAPVLGGCLSPPTSDEVLSSDAVNGMLMNSWLDTAKLDNMMKGMGGCDGGVPANLQELMEILSGW